MRKPFSRWTIRPRCARWCARRLQSAGYGVVEAADGQEALDFARANAVDLVISDVNMPRMDGIRLVSELRALPDYRLTPLLLLTTESSQEKKARGQTRRRHRLDRQALQSRRSSWRPSRACSEPHESSLPFHCRRCSSSPRASSKSRCRTRIRRSSGSPTRWTRSRSSAPNCARIPIRGRGAGRARDRRGATRNVRHAIPRPTRATPATRARRTRRPARCAGGAECTAAAVLLGRDPRALHHGRRTTAVRHAARAPAAAHRRPNSDSDHEALRGSVELF